jgi:hypothetical protein
MFPKRNGSRDGIGVLGIDRYEEWSGGVRSVWTMYKSSKQQYKAYSPCQLPPASGRQAVLESV